MRGHTQAELAKKVGIGQVLVSAYETDRRLILGGDGRAVCPGARCSAWTSSCIPGRKKVSTKMPNRRVQRRVEKIERLPPHQQNYLLKTIYGS